MSEVETRFKIVLLVGYPRSGTTWLTMLLTQHPAVTSMLHAGLFHALRPLHDWWQTPRPHGKWVFHFDQTAPDGMKRSDLTQFLRGEALAGHIGSITRDVFAMAAQQSPRTQVLIEKTPENLAFLDWIVPAVPEVHVLHIIRDPRSTYASVRRSQADWAGEGAFPEGAAANGTGWLDYMNRAERLHDQIGAQYRSLTYEQLVVDGVPVLGGLFDWLGLPVNEVFCQEALNATGIDELRAKKIMPRGFFRKGRVESWRTELNQGEIKTIEYLAGDWMDQMGYEREYPNSTRPPFALRWRQTIGRAGGFIQFRLWESESIQRLKRRWRRWIR